MSLSAGLRFYADSLAPSEKVVAAAGTVIERIQSVIHQRLGNKYSIDRIRPLGSYTKKTSLWFKMDIDIVIYLNGENPPFKNFKRHLDDVATMHLDEDCKENPSGIKLWVNGFEIDLLPAANYLYKHGYTGEEDEAEVQTKNAIRFLQNNPDIWREDKMAFSSTLSEGAIKFEQLRSAFSHSISRLAKLWSSTVGIPGFSFGRSTIMEYLGAKAAEEEERTNRGSQDVLSGFRRFLQMIERPGSLNIIWEIFYRKSDVPIHVRQQRPLLLDPTNPYNNLLEGNLGTYLSKMSPYASETLKRLRLAEGRECCPVDEIFKPQPAWDRIFVISGPRKSPRSFLVGHKQERLSVPRIETRSGAKGVDPKVAQSYLFAYADAVLAASKLNVRSAGGSGITERVKTELKKLIDPTCQWSPSGERHEDKDMTFTIPVGKEANEVIKISCDWR